MKYIWLKIIFPIAAIFSFRMLGLFMLIPVFSVYAQDLAGSTPFLIGTALGAYGLSQGILQIPFGLLSDKYGRKPMLFVGLALLGAGSLLGALTHSMTGMIIARTLQGTGAIGSVLIALLADLTPDTLRTPAMAIIGSTIAISFSLAFILSPYLVLFHGLSAIFYLTTLLAIFAVLLLYYVIPNPVKEPFSTESNNHYERLRAVFKNIHLTRLNIGIFVQHLILTSTFFYVPLRLQTEMTQGKLEQAWHFYLPILVFSFLLMLPFVMYAEKRKKAKPLFLSAVFLTLVTQIGLVFFSGWMALCILIFVYFIGFNMLEAILPSLVSRQASMASKGTAMGVYSSSQFLGIFAGGTLAGFLYQYQGSEAIFVTNAIFALIWLISTLSMNPYYYVITLSFPFEYEEANHPKILETLAKLTGVEEVSIHQNTLYVRVNKALYQDGGVEQILESKR